MTDWTARWQQTWHGLALAPPPEPELGTLLTRYREPQRHYHTLQHLAECFAAFDQLRDQASDPAAIALALWYHDAVYDPRRRDNEALSAALAADALREAGAGATAIRRVHDLIMATRSHEAGDDPDCAIVLDVDLAILGAPPARFADYERQIRAEYAHVPHDAYRIGRARVLAGFAERDPLYRTGRFRALYEQQAKQNMQHA